MTGKTIKAAREGWFTLDSDAPHLIGSQCAQCSTYYFPENTVYCRNPQCDSDDLNKVELSRRGKIWSYTDSQYAPPEPFVAADPYVPVSLAAVELEKEQMIVLGQLVDGITVEDIKVGDQVELALGTLFEDEHHTHVVWKWKPVNA